jgi:hypothetical protein
MAYCRLWLAAATLCLSCGSSFVSSDNGTGGGSPSAGATGTSGGSTSSGGAQSGGSAGASAAGAGAGGASAGNGGAANGGAANGGAANGGASGAAGSAGAADCATLKTEYAADVDKARGCDSGSTDQCSTSSTLPAIGCGCPTLVNAKSTYTTLAKAKYQAIQDAKCAAGPICNIACLGYTSASCSAQMIATGTAYECTGTTGVTTN